MKSKRLNWLACGVLLVFALSCGKSPEEKRAEEAAKKLEEASDQFSQAMKQGGEGVAEAMKAMGEAVSGGKKVEPVDFRELKALLPDNLPGMKRTNASGERTSAFGIRVANAEASYEDDQGRSIDITITDMGSMSGLTALAAYGWAAAEFDRETDSGYERTTTYNGHRAYEKYDTGDKSGQIQVLVAGRFVVEVSGSNVDMKDLKAALAKIDLGRLDKMKNRGVKD